MSKMNPGFRTKKPELHPELTGTPDLGLADYIVKNKMFNFFLWDGCIPFTDEYELMNKIVAPLDGKDWKYPIAVMGYDNSWPVSGDLFEAETSCTRQHNMG